MEYSKLVLKSARKAWEKINIITEDKPTIFKDDKEFSEFYNQLQDRLNEKEKRKDLNILNKNAFLPDFAPK